MIRLRLRIFGKNITEVKLGHQEVNDDNHYWLTSNLVKVVSARLFHSLYSCSKIFGDSANILFLIIPLPTNVCIY